MIFHVFFCQLKPLFLVNDINVFSTFNITTDESLPIWEEFSPLFLNFKGNTEKFYIEFYKFCLPENIFSANFLDDCQLCFVICCAVKLLPFVYDNSLKKTKKVILLKYTLPLKYSLKFILSEIQNITEKDMECM